MGDTCTVQQVGKQAEMGRATVNNAGWAKTFYGDMGQGSLKGLEERMQGTRV